MSMALCTKLGVDASPYVANTLATSRDLLFQARKSHRRQRQPPA
jgi:hypothetical protein